MVDPSFWLGAASSLAASAAYTGIVLLARRQSKKLSDPEKTELQRALADAFSKTLLSMFSDLDQDVQVLIEEILKEFVQDTSNIEQLVVLALDQQEPDYQLLHDWFIKTDFDTETLPFNPDEFIDKLVRNLAETLLAAASKPDSQLTNLVTISLLQEILTRQVQAASSPDIFEISKEHCRGFVPFTLQTPLVRGQLLNALYEFAISGNGVVIGRPGAGKSYCLSELSKYLLDHGHPYICISVTGVQSRADLMAIFGLQTDLVTYLRSAIPQLNDSVGIILIDGFDAARSTERRGFFRTLIEELIRELQPHWKVIVSVRTFDAKKSQNLLDSFPTIPDAQPLEIFQEKDIRCRHFLVPLLNDDERQQFVQQTAGLAPIFANATSSFRELLRVPFNLWLIEKLLPDKAALLAESKVTTETELLSLYWKYRIEDQEHSYSMGELLVHVVTTMLENMKLEAQLRTLHLSTENSEVLTELLSLEVLVNSSPMGRSIQFAHNTLFDYAVARLVMPDNPDDFVEFFGTDAFKPLFLIPSIEFFFSYLWLNQGAGFWDIFWKIYAPDVSVQLKLFGRLIPPRIITSQLSDIEQLSPLIDAINNSEPNADLAAVAVIRALLKQGVKQLNIWASFLIAVMDATSAALVLDFGKLTDDLIKLGKQTSNYEVLVQCGISARSFAEWILKERTGPLGGWIDRVGPSLILPLVLKTYGSDPEKSRAIVENIIILIQNKEMPLQYLSRIIDHFDEIIPYSPDLIAILYKLILQSGDLGDGSPLIGGIIVQLIFSAESEREFLDHQLTRYYPRFLKAETNLALATGIRAINFIVVRDHIRPFLREGVTLEDIIKPLQLRGSNTFFIPDHNYIWTSISPHDHEPLYMVTQMFDYLEYLIQEKQLDEVILNEILDSFRDNALVAYLWSRLLRFASRYPNLFAVPLLELISNEILLYSDDVAFELRRFLKLAAPIYSEEQMQGLETAIMSVPVDELNPKRREQLEHIRLHLLSQIPAECLIGEDAKKLKSEIDASDEAYSNLPLGMVTSWEGSFDEDKQLKEAGVNIEAEENQILRSLVEPLNQFKERWKDKLPEAEAVTATMPHVHQLYSVLQENSVDAEEMVIDLAWTSLGETVARMCLVPEVDLTFTAVFKEILLQCAQNRSPELHDGDEENYDSPFFYEFARGAAAQGLFTLAQYDVDETVLHTLVKLLEDKVPFVRFLSAQRLWLTYKLSRDFFWETIAKLLEQETNKVVLQTLFGNILGLPLIDTAEARNLLVSHIGILLNLEPDGDLIQEVIGALSFYMFVKEDDRAYELNQRITEEPIKYALPLSHLSFRALNFISVRAFLDVSRRPSAIRALSWTMLALDAASNGLSIMLKNAKDTSLSETDRDSLRNLQQVIDTAVNQLSFQLRMKNDPDQDDEKISLSDEDRCVFYSEIKVILEHISNLGFDKAQAIIPAYTAHRFMQVMNCVLYCDPAGVLEMSLNMATASKVSNYQYDELAVKELVTLAEALLVDYQEMLLETTNVIRFLSLLEIFVDAGWSEALDFIGRLSELFR